MKSKIWSVVVCFALSALMAGVAVAVEEAAPLEGTFTANGEKVELLYAYAYEEDGGFYDEDDPAWTLLFVGRPLEAGDDYDMIWDAAYLRLGITETAEFGDEPVIQVYSQSIRFTADQSGNISGGSYPDLEITVTGPDRFSGRVHHTEVQEFFDDTFQYDFTFDVPLSDPVTAAGDSSAAGAVLEDGEPLPDGGGEPGAAFLAWCDAIHSGDFDRIKALLPDEQAAMLETEEERELFAEDLEFIQAMTPTEIQILGGSSNGETAVLQVTGSFDGETAHGEITMDFMDGHWNNSAASWK